MLKEAWEGSLAPKLHPLLDLMNVRWTSTDVVRIGNTGQSSASGILWIGMIHTSLSGSDGVLVASKCQELLVESNIADINVEIHELVVTCSASLKLHISTYPSDSTVNVHEPLTTTLSLPICAQSELCAEGTGGFFITECGNAKRLLLLTA